MSWHTRSQSGCCTYFWVKICQDPQLLSANCHSPKFHMLLTHLHEILGVKMSRSQILVVPCGFSGPRVRSISTNIPKKMWLEIFNRHIFVSLTRKLVVNIPLNRRFFFLRKKSLPNIQHPHFSGIFSKGRQFSDEIYVGHLDQLINPLDFFWTNPSPGLLLMGKRTEPWGFCLYQAPAMRVWDGC